MGAIADLVVSVRADTTQFKKDLKTKLGAATKGAGAGVGAGGGVGSALLGAAGLGAAAATGIGAVVVGIKLLGSLAKKTFKLMTQESRVFSMLSNFLTGTLGIVTDLIMIGIWRLLVALSPIVQPIIDLVSTLWDKLSGPIGDIVAIWRDDIGPNIRSIFTSIGLIAKDIWALMEPIWSLKIGAVVFAIEALSEMLSPIVENIALILSTMRTIKDTFAPSGVTNKILDKLGVDMGESKTGIGDTLKATLTGGVFLGMIKDNNEKMLALQEKIAEAQARLVEEQFMRKTVQEIGSMKDKYSGEFMARAQRLAAAGFSWQEIWSTLQAWINSVMGEKRAAQYGVEYSGTGGLVIPQDYWGNAYDGIGTGAWM